MAVDSGGGPLGWSRPRRRSITIELVVLAAAIAGGSALRLVDLGAVGLNSDEAVYAGQAASLAGNPHFTRLFPVVRAHPLLFQMLISPLYRDGVPDVAGRYVAAGFGIATVGLVFATGSALYDRRAGALAAALLAAMPYHVVISRQILLDGPMTFFATAGLCGVAVFARTEDRRWLVAAGGCIGLAALTKETAIVLVGSGFAFLTVTSRLWRPVRHVIAAGIAAIGLASVYPIVTALAGGSRSGQSYLTWQLTRPPNHSFTFYLTEVPKAMGVLVVASAVLGVVLRRRRSWREALLVAWVAVPFVFFEVWPVKGFPYLLFTAPAIAVLAAASVNRLAELGGPALWKRAGSLGCAVLLVVSVGVPAVKYLTTPSTSSLAGAGGTAGGREAARWVSAHVPAGARLMTIGPSMANIIEYYSGHRSDALSVSPDPAHRNPTYDAIANPSGALRAGVYQYVVWDAYSASRSPTFAAKILALARRFDGRVVHVELAGRQGRLAQPVIVIYQVVS